MPIMVCEFAGPLEVAVFEAPAAQTARGGRRLPEPPHSPGTQMADAV